MEDTNSLIEQRKAKLAALRAKGIDPFKNKFTPDLGAGEARAKFESGELAEHAKVSVAGRITAHRDMGKSMFIDVRDQSGRIQIYAQKSALGDDPFHTFTHLDLPSSLFFSPSFFFLLLLLRAVPHQDQRAEHQNCSLHHPRQIAPPAAD